MLRDKSASGADDAIGNEGVMVEATSARVAEVAITHTVVPIHVRPAGQDKVDRDGGSIKALGMEQGYSVTIKALAPKRTLASRPITNQQTETGER